MAPGLELAVKKQERQRCGPPRMLPPLPPLPLQDAHMFSHPWECTLVLLVLMRTFRQPDCQRNWFHKLR